MISKLLIRTIIKTEKEDSGLIHELFEHQLQDIYWAENELDKFIPKVVSQVSSEELKAVFEEHMRITKEQIKRLENVFELIGAEPKGEKCDGMEGLIKEAESIIEEADEGMVRDAFIIGSVQKVEHYEMASYGTLRALASIIGEYEVATLLGETLKEEKEADYKLTEVAENLVNIEAANESGVLEDESEEFEEAEEFEEEGTQGRSKSSTKSSSRPKSKSKN